MYSIHIFALFSFFALVLAAPLQAGEPGHSHGEAGHAHGSPHGGVVTTLGSYHAEWVVDSATGKVDLYILGDDAVKAATVDGTDLTAQVRLKDKESFTAVTLKPNAFEGEKAGTASRFSGQSDALKNAAGMEAAVHVSIGSKRLRAKFDWKPGGGHEGHTHAESGPATVIATVTALSPLAPGKSSQVVLSLKDKTGKAISFDDLEIVHTRRIHLLVVDASLTDYQHIHPTPTDRSGEFKFDFTPLKTGQYKVFADLLPLATKRQEYSPTMLEVPGESSPVDRKSNLETTVDGFKFVLSFDRTDLKADEAMAASVLVTGPDGKPFTLLEPVMGAFAHAVAFDEKREQTVHIHPLGREPEKETERGGPKLDFHMKFSEAGFWKLYIQVQIDGKDVFAPFGLQIADSGKPRAVASKMLNNMTCPITGKPVHSMQADAHLIFNDTRVELCCAGCEKTFMDSPTAAFKKATTAGKN